MREFHGAFEKTPRMTKWADERTYARILVQGCVAILLSMAALSAFGQPQPIDDVKAAFVYKFANFVEWPAESFESEKDSVQIGVAATAKFVDTIREIVDGKTVSGRRIEVISSRDADDLSQCEIVYISSEDEDLQGKLLPALRAKPILTIGDTADFAEEGGIIRLFEEGRRLRFEINLDAAKEAKLRISSKLLDLASAVFGNANLDEQ
jgi:hypothetical protein